MSSIGDHTSPPYDHSMNKIKAEKNKAKQQVMQTTLNEIEVKDTFGNKITTNNFPEIKFDPDKKQYYIRITINKGGKDMSYRYFAEGAKDEAAAKEMLQDNIAEWILVAQTHDLSKGEIWRPENSSTYRLPKSGLLSRLWSREKLQTTMKNANAAARTLAKIVKQEKKITPQDKTDAEKKARYWTYLAIIRGVHPNNLLISSNQHQITDQKPLPKNENPLTELNGPAATTPLHSTTENGSNPIHSDDESEPNTTNTSNQASQDIVVASEDNIIDGYERQREIQNLLPNDYLIWESQTSKGHFALKINNRIIPLHDGWEDRMFSFPRSDGGKILKNAIEIYIRLPKGYPIQFLKNGTVFIFTLDQKERKFSLDQLDRFLALPRHENGVIYPEALDLFFYLEDKYGDYFALPDLDDPSISVPDTNGFKFQVDEEGGFVLSIGGDNAIKLPNNQISTISCLLKFHPFYSLNDALSIAKRLPKNHSIIRSNNKLFIMIENKQILLSDTVLDRILSLPIKDGKIPQGIFQAALLLPPNCYIEPDEDENCFRLTTPQGRFTFENDTCTLINSLQKKGKILIDDLERKILIPSILPEGFELSNHNGKYLIKFENTQFLLRTHMVNVLLKMSLQQVQLFLHLYFQNVISHKSYENHEIPREVLELGALLPRKLPNGYEVVMEKKQYFIKGNGKNIKLDHFMFYGFFKIKDEQVEKFLHRSQLRQDCFVLTELVREDLGFDRFAPYEHSSQDNQLLELIKVDDKSKKIPISEEQCEELIKYCSQVLKDPTKIEENQSEEFDFNVLKNMIAKKILAKHEMSEKKQALMNKTNEILESRDSAD